MTRAALPLAALLVALAGAAPAEDDFVEAQGPLATRDFYRLVSCRAAPGGPCAEDPVAWEASRARHLTLALAPPPAGFPRDLAHRVDLALDHAMAEIDGAGAGLHLTRAETLEAADVAVYLTPSRSGEPIEGTGLPGVDGEVVSSALVTVWWDESLHLTGAAVVVAADIRPEDVTSVVLEEVTQAMGLMTDIRDPFYEGLSVFSEDSNAATRLGDQDREALRLHYPPRDRATSSEGTP